MKVINTHKFASLLKLQLMLLTCFAGLLTVEVEASDWSKWMQWREEFRERIRQYRNRGDVQQMARSIQSEAAANGAEMTGDSAETYAANLQLTLDSLTPAQRAEVIQQ